MIPIVFAGNYVRVVLSTQLALAKIGKENCHHISITFNQSLLLDVDSDQNVSNKYIMT